MKIKTNLNAIAGISLSIVAVISMSFKSQESIETKAQETSFADIQNLSSKEVGKTYKVKAVNAFAATVTAAVAVYNAVKGTRSSSIDDINEYSLESEKLLITNFD